MGLTIGGERDQMTEEKDKKKATFRKVEEGMILESQDGRTYAFGLPETVEKMTGA
jgi:hypothetical protein